MHIHACMYRRLMSILAISPCISPDVDDGVVAGESTCKSCSMRPLIVTQNIALLKIWHINSSYAQASVFQMRIFIPAATCPFTTYTRICDDLFRKVECILYHLIKVINQMCRIAKRAWQPLHVIACGFNSVTMIDCIHLM